MRVFITFSSSLLLAAGCAPESSLHSTMHSESTHRVGHAPAALRAVANPGFAFIDVDGDDRYDASVDQVAVLDSSGSLSTPYSLVVPHDRSGPLLSSEEAVTLDIGGDLSLQGTIDCDNTCSGSSAAASTDCTIDITVGGEVDAKSKGALIASAQVGSAEIFLSVAGEVDLRQIDVAAAHGSSSSAQSTVVLEAGGSVDLLGADVLLSGSGDRSLTIATQGDDLSLAKMDVDADSVELYSCDTTAAGCSGVPVVDLRRFKMASSSASVCLDEDDISSASGLAVRTNRRTTSNTCQ